MKSIITRDFRNLILSTYPALSNNTVYWRLIQVLMFGLKDKDTGLPLLSYIGLAIIEHGFYRGYNIAYQKNYKGLTLLLDFQSKVMTPETFSWTDADFTEHRARSAIVIFTPEIEERIQIELDLVLSPNYLNNDLVYMISGLKYNKKTAKQMHNQLQEQVNMNNDRTATIEQKPLLDYLNNKISVAQLSNIIRPNIAQAVLAIATIEDSLKRNHQAAHLAAILEDPKPLYQPSINGNTVRIFPANMSILGLKREIKKILCKGLYEFDLASSQLAIVSQTWDIPYIKDYLNNGNKIWLDLCVRLNIEYNSDNKDVLKQALYSLIFGMSKRNLLLNISAAFGKVATSRWITDPVISLLFLHREKRMKEILEAGKLITLYGKEVLITGKTKQLKQECLRSALAQEAQSVEFYLMQPILDLALTTNEFSIVLFQHDGCSIKFNDKSKQQRWINRIITSVQQRADSLSIPTHLEMEIL